MRKLNSARRYALRALAIMAFSGSALASAETLEVPPGRSVTIDGWATPGEWDDAARRALRSAAGPVEVRVKHDGAALLVSFSGLSSSPFRVPEVLLSAKPGSEALGDHSWWFHASYTDCVSNGGVKDWGSCGEHSSVFRAVNLRDAADGGTVFPEVFEILAPLATVGLSAGDRLGLAFVITDTTETWELWPGGAEMEKPATWASAHLAGGGDPPPDGARD